MFNSIETLQQDCVVTPNSHICIPDIVYIDMKLQAAQGRLLTFACT